LSLPNIVFTVMLVVFYYVFFFLDVTLNVAQCGILLEVFTGYLSSFVWSCYLFVLICYLVVLIISLFLYKV